MISSNAIATAAAAQLALAGLTFTFASAAGAAEPRVSGAHPASSLAVAASSYPTAGAGVDTYSSEDGWQESKPGRVSGFMGWAFNVPLGSVRNFTSVASLLGFELQFNGWLTRNVSLGVSGEWATYVENRPRTTYSLDHAQITATAYNSMQTTSARMLLHYCFLGRGPLEPYVGPHLGVSWSTFDSEAADLTLADNEFSVNFGAEAGVQIPLGPIGPTALVNLRYSTSPAAEFRNAVSNVQSLGILLGIGF